MKDTTIVRIAEETSNALSEIDAEWELKRVIPSYNALLQAAKANHPSDPFLSTLSHIQLDKDEDGISVGELRILFAQLRIALESLESEEANPQFR